MISKSQAKDRMDTCDERLARRTEDAIERNILDSADRKDDHTFYQFPSNSPALKARMIEKLRGLGYEVTESIGHHGVYIKWG